MVLSFIFRLLFYPLFGFRGLAGLFAGTNLLTAKSLRNVHKTRFTWRFCTHMQHRVLTVCSR